MNDYRITYVSETGESSNAYVTERTESAARKSFNSTHKGMGFTIQKIELHRTGTNATKQQERDTLAAIRKMVEELGPQSYLATAFEGCFEDAEQNIEYDFGCSQKKLADAAAEKVTELEDRVKELERKLAQEIAEKQQARNEAQSVIKKLEVRTLSEDDLKDIRQLLDDRKIDADHSAELAAAEIVEHADDPSSKEFRQAVADHRNFSGTAKYYRELLGRVVAAQTAASARS